MPQIGTSAGSAFAPVAPPGGLATNLGKRDYTQHQQQIKQEKPGRGTDSDSEHPGTAKRFKRHHDHNNDGLSSGDEDNDKNSDAEEEDEDAALFANNTQQ